MKNFNKLFVGILVAFGLLVIGLNSSESSVGVRSPKAVYLYNYSTSISSITAFTVLQATSTSQNQPGAVYELNLSTGAAGDFFVLYDTIPVNAAALQTPGSAAATTNLGYQLGPRFFYSSTSANTKITFDPPLVFEHGLMIVGSSTTESASVTYELGRGLSGQ